MVGQNIRWARTLRGLTQTQLAESIRVHRHPTTASYISRLESGTIDPRVSTLLSIARALKIRPSLLVTRVGEGEDFLEVYMSLVPSQKRNLRAIIRMWRSRV